MDGFHVELYDRHQVGSWYFSYLDRLMSFKVYYIYITCKISIEFIQKIYSINEGFHTNSVLSCSVSGSDPIWWGPWVSYVSCFAAMDVLKICRETKVRDQSVDFFTAQWEGFRLKTACQWVYIKYISHKFYNNGIRYACSTADPFESAWINLNLLKSDWIRFNPHKSC